MSTAETLQPVQSLEFYNPELDHMQDEGVDVLAQARADGIERGYINVVMGGGKTRIIAREIASFLEDQPEAKVLYLCHDANILSQAMGEFAERLKPDTDIGSIMKGNLDHESQVTMASFQQLNREITPGGAKLYEIIPEDHYDYIVVDESHHGPAPTYKQVIQHFTPQFLRGMTGTANRLDRQDISAIFGEELFFVSIEEAIARGFVSALDYRVFGEELQHGGDDETEGLSFQEIVDKKFKKRDPSETVRIINEQIADVENPKTLVFCRTTAEADLYAGLLDGAATLHSKMHPEEQAEVLRRYKLGTIKTLVAVEMMNEGVDVRDINVVAFVRSTESEAVFLQQLGRGLRRAIGKDSVRVLDFVANFERVKYIGALQERLRDASKEFPRTSGESVPFNFRFSEQTKKVLHHIARMRRNIQGSANTEAIEELLGGKLADNQRMSQHQQRLLIEGIQNGDKRAELDYLSYRARTIYAAIHKFPEMNGLTRADYFQIGTEAMLEQARGVDLKKASMNQLAAKLMGKVQSTVAQAIRNNGVPLDLEVESTMVVRGTTILPENVMTWKQAKADGHYIEDHAEAVEDATMKASQLDALEELSYRERRVLELRYGLGGDDALTLDETGRVFNVSRERVRQIENQSLKKLQSSHAMVEVRYPRALIRKIKVGNAFEYASAIALGYAAEYRTKPAKIHPGPLSRLTDHGVDGLSATLTTSAQQRAGRKASATQLQPQRNEDSRESIEASINPLIRDLFIERAEKLGRLDIKSELRRSRELQRDLETALKADIGKRSMRTYRMHRGEIKKALGRLAHWQVALDIVLEDR